MRPVLRQLLSLVSISALTAQASLACVLPPPMMAAFVENSLKDRPWQLTQASGLDLAHAPLTLALASDGRLEVQGLCLNLSGSYRGDNRVLLLVPEWPTDTAACEDAALRTDQQLASLLAQVYGYSLSKDGQTLTLSYADGASLILEPLAKG